MSYQQFEVPGNDELSAFEQIDVALLEGEPGVFSVRAEALNGESLELVVAPLGRSIRLIVSTGDRRALDLYREGATKFGIREIDGTLIFAVRFDVEELAGKIEVSVGEEIQVKDSLLFQ